MGWKYNFKNDVSKTLTTAEQLCKKMNQEDKVGNSYHIGLTHQAIPFVHFKQFLLYSS